MRGFLVDVNNSKFEVIQTDKDFQLCNYYDFLNCDTIDIVRRRIGNRYYEVICDDEGLLKAGNKISAVDSELTTMFVGNLFIRGQAREGEMTNLTLNDINHIKDRMLWLVTAEHPEGYWILTECEY